MTPEIMKKASRLVDAKNAGKDVGDIAGFVGIPAASLRGFFATMKALGTEVKRKPMSEENRAKARDRMKKARAARQQEMSPEELAEFRRWKQFMAGAGTNNGRSVHA